MSVLITCKTNRFNLSVVGSDFINDCCFGEDFSAWLTAALDAAGTETRCALMEDFGWYSEVCFQDTLYTVLIGGTSDGNPQQPDLGTWTVVLGHWRTFWQKLRRRQEITLQDPLVSAVTRILQQAGFEDVAAELDP